MWVPWTVIAADARRRGVLRANESASKCKPLRLAKKALDIRSRHRGFGGPVEWQIRPPKWASMSLDGREW
jgi:hypothetical protein